MVDIHETGNSISQLERGLAYWKERALSKWGDEAELRRIQGVVEQQSQSQQALVAHNGNLERVVSELTTQLELQIQQSDALEAERIRLGGQLLEQHQIIETLTSQVRELGAQLHAASVRASEAEARVDQIHQSRSWRITRPLRRGSGRSD